MNTPESERQRGQGKIDIVSPQEWISRLESVRDDAEEGRQHPAKKLLGLWKDAVSQLIFLPFLLPFLTLSFF